MGQKVNPFSLRLTINKDWKSKWFGKNQFAEFISSDLAIRQAIEKKFGKTAGIAKVEILRDHEAITINLYTSKPGVLIGRSGQGIVDLKLYLVKHVEKFRIANSNKLPKIKLEIIEIKNAEANAQLVAESIAIQLEKRIMYKRAVKQAIAKAMEVKVKGIKIKVAGRLNGAEIARSEKYGESSVPLGRLRGDLFTDYYHDFFVCLLFFFFYDNCGHVGMSCKTHFHLFVSFPRTRESTHL
ncbi:MAG: 30S ribosomal protein S3 [Candidatus Wolfebacteria bacterium]|nr:30S ribosomal protein S3 [Candidatus Wolfebacteria bacterium]